MDEIEDNLEELNKKIENRISDIKSKMLEEIKKKKAAIAQNGNTESKK